MNLEQNIVVKTEVQPNGDILLFYVDGKSFIIYVFTAITSVGILFINLIYFALLGKDLGPTTSQLQVGRLHINTIEN